MSTGINLKDARPHQSIPSGNFDLSFRRKYDCQIGRLIPSLCIPIMPDDTIDLSFHQLVRTAPFVSQVYQDFVIANDFYFVPNRLVYHDFNNFMTAGYNGATERIHPYIDFRSIISSLGDRQPTTHHHLFNYMDIPNSFFSNLVIGKGNFPINAIPFGAYMRIFLDYWLGTSMPLSYLYEKIVNADNSIFDDGDMTNDFLQLYARLSALDPEYVIPDPLEIVDADFFDLLFQPLPRLYPLDYFTMGRPEPQLGPVMTIPLKLINTDEDGTSTFQIINPAASSNQQSLYFTYTQGSNTVTLQGQGSSNNVTVNGSVFNNVASINDFYSAARIQELLTLYGFSGFMPQDTVAAEFGVKSDDRSLQRSQFVHHHQEIIDIGEVFSNNVNNNDTNLTDIPGVGTAIGKSTHNDRGFRFHSGADHGFLFCLTSIYPKAGYNQGLPRIYTQLDRFDYPHPLLSELSMQSIKQRELFCGDFANWDNDFAYVPRYSDYKVGIDRDNGDFAAGLQYMSDIRRIDEQYAKFNDMFLRVIPSVNGLNRPFNVSSYLSSSSPMFVDTHFNIRANRHLPYYGLPKF